MPSPEVIAINCPAALQIVIVTATELHEVLCSGAR